MSTYVVVFVCQPGQATVADHIGAEIVEQSLCLENVIHIDWFGREASNEAYGCDEVLCGFKMGFNVAELLPDEYHCWQEHEDNPVSAFPHFEFCEVVN